MPHHTWPYPPHKRCSLPTEACGDRIKRLNLFGALRSHDSRGCAAQGDLALINSAAGTNGRIHNRAVVPTVAPAVNTEWVCPPNPQRYHGLSHIVPLQEGHHDIRSHPFYSSNTCQDPEPVPAAQQAAHTAQALPLQVHLKTHQPHRDEQQDLHEPQQPPSVHPLQHADTVANVSEGPVDPLGSDNAQPTQAQQLRVQQQQQSQLQRQHGPVLERQEGKQQQKREQQQEQLQPQHRHKERSDRCHPRQHAHSTTVRVSNATSTDGMAHYLLSKVQQQLKKARQREQQQGVCHQQNMSRPEQAVDGQGQLLPAITSQQTITLQCSSGKSLHTALQAIGLAAQQAARLCQPQQLLLRPQMVRNSIDAAADDRHGAGVYQLQILRVPAAAVAVGHQVQQQQPHTAPRQHQKPRQGHQCGGPPQDTHCRSASVSQGAGLQAADAAAAGIAGVRQSQPLVCDSPAREQRQATGKHSGHTSSRTAQSSKPHSRMSVQSLSWHVSGLLRGNWPAQLQCSSPAGALTAVKALVRARKQLAAAGMDMVIAVTPSGQDRASGTGEAAVAAHSILSGPQVVLWAVGYTVQQAEHGPSGAAHAGRLSNSCHASQVEFVRVPAAEQYLRQQQQERRKHKQMLTDLQQQQQRRQQNSAPTASTAAVPEQQQQHPHQHITCVHQRHASYAVGTHSLEALLLIIAPPTLSSSQQNHNHEQRLLQLPPVGPPGSPVQAKEQQQQEQMRLLSLQGLSKPQDGHHQPSPAAATAGGVPAARSNYDRQSEQPQQPLQPQDLCCQQPIMLPV